MSGVDPGFFRGGSTYSGENRDFGMLVSGRVIVIIWGKHVESNTCNIGKCNFKSINILPERL